MSKAVTVLITKVTLDSQWLLKANSKFSVFKFRPDCLLFRPPFDNLDIRAKSDQHSNVYRWDLNIGHGHSAGIWILTIQILETYEYHTFWSLDFKWSVQGYVLCTGPTIWIPDKYIRKQDFQMAFENQTIWHPTSFRPLEYQTFFVFRSPLQTNCSDACYSGFT